MVKLRHVLQFDTRTRFDNANTTSLNLCMCLLKKKKKTHPVTSFISLKYYIEPWCVPLAKIPRNARFLQSVAT
uniref:Uncharacterized protein n=1 Tax=Pararge aegeria TaxID=116150 RepID=S4P6Y5_9NEOP